VGRAQADADPAPEDKDEEDAMATPSRPNMLVIRGDDIGIWNLLCYSRGMMGYRTPNIDRIAAEGMLFTDACGEQSCTAGRASFITGQSVFRTGLSKVGAPGMDVGLQAEDPTIADGGVPRHASRSRGRPMGVILHAAANQITLALQAIAILLVASGGVPALAGIVRSVLPSPCGTAAAPRAG
jgi:hypothetical protein